MSMCTRFDRAASNPGCQFKNIYTPKVNDDGVIDLIPSGVEDLHEFYNSFKEECDPNYIVARFNAGDPTVLNRAQPVFMDCLNAPKTLAEAYALNIKAAAAFESLPSDVKEQFGNSYYRFISEAGSDSWFESIGVNTKDQTSNVKEESSVEE